MTYGITGNTQKDALWEPAARLVHRLRADGLDFCLHEDVAEGLQARGLVEGAVCAQHRTADLTRDADLILSFGGDGTLLLSAHEVDTAGTPILGVNIGRLGFLADIEVGQLEATIERLERGDYRIEKRMVLEARFGNGVAMETSWALNEFVIERSGAAKLIAIDVAVDGVALNTYWADGLIVATPTGSTAYSLSTGGPLVMPGVDALILTPIAPHTLTVRPLVLPDTSVVEVRVQAGQPPYVVAADGYSTLVEEENVPITLCRAAHTVNLVKLPEQHYFQTIRSKLMWGARNER